ncbi:MAG: signal peptidase II [Eggerthellaceae bacterium]
MARFDQLTKAYFQTLYARQVSASGSGCSFRLRNTGAAWGMFGDSTFALGVVSVVVCIAVVLVFLFYERAFGHRATALRPALSRSCRGGIGNAIDRFVNGFVVDFIDLTFMDFPVFNIADIGVTCGFVLLVIGYLLATRPPSRKETTSSCDEGKEAHHD